jgi:hypothetical protein
MDQPSSLIVGIPINLSIDVREESGISDSTIYGDSIPITDGVLSNNYRWHEENATKVRFVFKYITTRL